MKKFSLITNLISILMIIGVVVFLVCIWKNIPEVVPIHFNAAGIADSFDKKSSLFIEIVIMTVSFLLLAVLERFPKLWNYPVEVTTENRKRLYKSTLYMLGLLKIIIMGMCIIGVLSSVYAGFPIWIMYILIGFMFAIIIAGTVACFVKKN